jgi:LAS superfamily LD-carboxypeptidase LdcB
MLSAGNNLSASIVINRMWPRSISSFAESGYQSGAERENRKDQDAFVARDAKQNPNHSYHQRPGLFSDSGPTAPSQPVGSRLFASVSSTHYGYRGAHEPLESPHAVKFGANLVQLTKALD